jgi:Holliday junction resolvase RusA-like endonuclease
VGGKEKSGGKRKRNKNRPRLKLEIVSHGDNFLLISFKGSASVNRVYRNKNGVLKPYPIHKKAFGYIEKNYADIIEYPFKKFEKMKLVYYVIFNDKRTRDVDNYIKIFSDLWSRYFVKVDDSAVFSFTATKVVLTSAKTHYIWIQWFPYDEQNHIEDIEKVKDALSRLITSKNNQ